MAKKRIDHEEMKAGRQGMEATSRDVRGNSTDESSQEALEEIDVFLGSDVSWEEIKKGLD